MTTTEIMVFLAICRHKNISRAAEELYISQASLSAHLKTLEAELGCTLLIRRKGKRSLSLTTQGQAFYQLALQYQNLMQKMSALDKGEALETLQISAISSVGNYILPPVLRYFLEKYPRIRLTMQDIEAEEAFLSIIGGKTDMAFSTAKMETDQIVAIPFLRDPFTILCTADAPFAQTVTLKELSNWDEVYLRWSAEYEFWHQTAFGVESLCQFQLDLPNHLPLFVDRPGKWALVPQSVADKLCSDGKLRQCSPTFRVPDRTLYILRRRDNAESDSIHCFLDALREVLKQPFGDNLLL